MQITLHALYYAMPWKNQGGDPLVFFQFSPIPAGVFRKKLSTRGFNL